MGTKLANRRSLVREKDLTSTSGSSEDAVAELSSIDSARTPIFLRPEDDRGFELASTLDLEFNDIKSAPTDEWYLGCERGALALCHPTESPLVISERSIRTKIDEAHLTHLAKACLARPGRIVLDAFGGWGIDGFTLSALGCEVTILEINPLICTMARYLAQELGCSAKVVCTDAEQYLQCTNEVFDVVYFDPMFPVHPKSAKPARRMQILELMARKDTNIDQVFELAKGRTRDRLVFKRRRYETTKGLVPDWNVSGRSVRFDVYQIR